MLLSHSFLFSDRVGQSLALPVMGRGFGRGAKSVAIVTHAQAGTAGKKTPKGLRGVRQKKRQRFQKRGDETAELEQSLGLAKPSAKEGKGLAQQIASIQFPHIVNKRQKGFKQLRKQIMGAVKDVRRRHADKKRVQARKDTSLLVAKYEMEKGRRRR